MARRLKDLFGFLLVLLFALIMGFAVAVSVYWDGVGLRSLVMLGTWLAATGFLWSIPTVVPKMTRTKEVGRDERDRAILRDAVLAALLVSALYFLLACGAAGRWAGPNGEVFVRVIPLLVVGWILITQFTLVGSSLVLERFGGRRGA